MRVLLIPGLLALASAAFAEVTYNVVGYPKSSSGVMGVLINGRVTKLKTSDTTFPLWTGNVADASSSTSYQYVELDSSGSVQQKEPFTRTFRAGQGGSSTTMNEFFLRETTKMSLPKVPQLYKSVVPAPSQAFDDSQIATIHVSIDQATFDKMLKNPEEANPAMVQFRFINSDLVHSVAQVEMKFAGKSSMDYKKQSFKFKFDDKKQQTFFDRPSIKLRSEAGDPTLMREKIYIDVLNSVGIYTQQGAWVVLYINNKLWGIYLMVDDIGKSFLRTTIHRSNSATLGSLYQMNAPEENHRADLRYLGPTAKSYPDEVYTNKVVGDNPPNAPMTQLIRFMKDLQDFNPSSSDGLEFWKSRLDLDGFLITMALEYLGGAWDSYWYSASNYFLYFNPSLKVWQWVPTDFDDTLGKGVLEKQTTYKNYAPQLSKQDHPLVSKLILRNQAINQRFEKFLVEIQKGVFNGQALFARIDVYEKMIAGDVERDFNLVRTNKGKVTKYKIKDFHKGIVQGDDNMCPFGIKPWIQGRASGPVKRAMIHGPGALPTQPESSTTLSGGGGGGGGGSSGSGSAADSFKHGNLWSRCLIGSIAVGLVIFA